MKLVSCPGLQLNFPDSIKFVFFYIKYLHIFYNITFSKKYVEFIKAVGVKINHIYMRC